MTQVPRQPLIGIALAAICGILAAEFFAPPIGAACAVVGLAALVSLAWPRTVLTHFLITAAFFLLHLVTQTDASGRKLAAQLGERSRPVTVLGTVASEPKPQANAFTTFLLRLRAIEVGGAWQATDATLSVRWRGEPELGDEIRLRGIVEPIPPSRNPG